MNSFRNQNEPSKKISPSRRVRPSRCFTGSGLAWPRWVKAPGTNRRLRRLRPKSEWITIEQPELRIVNNSLWDAVRTKNEDHGQVL